MDTEEDARTARSGTEHVELRNLRRPWNAIRRTSPEQFISEQYDAILGEEHLIDYADEIYGANVLSET